MYVVCIHTSYAIIYLLVDVGNTAVNCLPQHKKQPTNKLPTYLPSTLQSNIIQHYLLPPLITTHRQDTNTAQQQQ